MVRTGAKMQDALKEAYQYAMGFLAEGETATYIPELEKADPSALGVSLALSDGTVYSHGQCDTAFTIQSISKVLTLMFALEYYGQDEVFGRVGMEPTGDPFNSMMKLETASQRPFNPMINAGAIVTASLIQEHNAFDEMVEFMKRLTGRTEITINEAVYQSEASHGSRNRSLAYLLSSKGVLGNNVDHCVDLYFRICSIEMTAEDLARIGLVLAMGGRLPGSSQMLIQPRIAQIVKTLMLTCGLYDGSGEFAVRTGIPSKSGVGGGILSCVNGQCGIGVYGPALDKKGNSVGGVNLLERLSQRLDLHVFPLGAGL